MRFILIGLLTALIAACNATTELRPEYARASTEEDPLPPDDRFGADVLPGLQGPR